MLAWRDGRASAASDDRYCRRTEEGKVMDDVVFLALSVAFFAATLGIAFLFERLQEQK